MGTRGDPVKDDSAESATVVVTQIVIAGREEDYKRWQQRTIDTARTFDGFEGAAMYPPSSPENREWVVVYRFSTVEKLGFWAQSEERRTLLNEGRTYFESPPTLEVLVGKPPPRDVITSVASHDVLPGKEQDFKHWQDRLTKAQERFPGFMGSELFQPVDGVQEHWVSLFRYDTPDHLARWLESDARAKLIREGGQYIRSFNLHTVKSPFSGWFGFSGRSGAAIPSWKQAMAVLLALYPTVIVLAHLTKSLFESLHIAGSLAIFVSLVLSTVILTWVLMPLVNRVFAFWLVPRGTNRVRADLIGTAAVLLCYAVFIVVAVVAFG